MFYVLTNQAVSWYINIMNTYTIEFFGRLAGAIGITYRIHETVQADTQGLAVLKLYDKYEHVSRLMITAK